MISRDETLAMVGLAIHLANVDLDLEIQEKRLLHFICRKIELTAEEIEKIKEEAISLHKLVSNIQSPDARQLLVSLLALMAVTDHVLEANELSFIQKVLQYFEMSPTDSPYLDEQGRPIEESLLRDRGQILMDIIGHRVDPGEAQEG
jgi:uncharacterized tellurite resistance protein B-like protein